MRIDCHIHLERGGYTVEWVGEFVKKAMERGLDEIRLLEHSFRFREFAPMYQSVIDYSDHQRDWFRQKNAGSLSIKDYTALIECARQTAFPIKIRYGLEICYFEGYESLIRDILNSYSFDFSVGSVHWVDGFGFDHGKEFWESVDVDRTYTRYYEIMHQLIESRLFAGVAHPDSIKVFGHKPLYDLAGAYEKLAGLLHDHDMYAEQSGGLHLNYSRNCELGMNPAMLGIFREKGVRILTASDAHRPEDAGANIAELQDLLNR